MHFALELGAHASRPQCPLLRAHAFCTASRPDRSSQIGAWRCSRASEGPAALPVLPGPLGAFLAAHSDYRSRSAHQQRAPPARAFCRCRHCRRRLPGSPHQSSAPPGRRRACSRPCNPFKPLSSELQPCLPPPAFPHCLSSCCQSVCRWPQVSRAGWEGHPLQLHVQWHCILRAVTMAF